MENITNPSQSSDEEEVKTKLKDGLLRLGNDFTISEENLITWRDLYYLDCLDTLSKMLSWGISKEDIIADVESMVKPQTDWTDDLLEEERQAAEKRWADTCLDGTGI